MEALVTKEIVFAYLSGNCSTFQKRLIEKWLREEENSERFFQWLCEWERLNIQYEVDIASGMKRHREWVSAYRSGKKLAAPPRREKTQANLKYIAVAAGVLIALAGVFFLFQDKVVYRSYKTTFGEIKKITLEDDSKVVLNANSELKVPRFSRWYDHRMVCLNGEANFEVCQSATRKRFFVKVGQGTEIEVLGTVFNVYNRNSEKRIALSQGKVKLNYFNKNRVRETITMRPGELATIKKSGKVELSNPDDVLRHSAWKYHRFVFDDQPFSEVGSRLEEVFGAKLIFEDASLSNQLISGTFTGLFPEELLDILKTGGDFEYKKKGKDFIITSAESRHH